MQSPTLRLLAFAVALGTCAGCSFTEPYERVGTWRPRGVNTGNLAMMIADPNDLDHGKQATAYDGVMAAAAIDRLHRDKVKALQDANFQVGGSTGATTTGATDTDGLN